MAYQNVGACRFYVNIAEYLSAVGYTEINDVFRLNPTSIKDGSVDESTSHRFYIPVGILGSKGYAAYLGHSGAGKFNISINYTNDFEVNAERNPNTTDNNSLSPEFKGWTLRSLDETVNDYIDVFCDNPLGSIVIGNYYDMPHSPDLNLKLSYEYDGVKTIQTKGGSTLSNASYTKPADWGDSGAWQLGGASNLRNGRRVWDLSFSYLSDTDVFPINASTGYQNITSDGYYVDNNNPTTGVVDIDTNQGLFDTNVLSGSDFFSVVWNKTMGGHLPFIFQPDSNNNNPDQFAIARFDMNSLQYEQVANNVYNVKLKIRESW